MIDIGYFTVLSTNGNNVDYISVKLHESIVEGLEKEIERLTHRALDLHNKTVDLEEIIEAQKDAGWEMSGEDC